MSLLKDLVDGLNHECIPNRQPGSFDQSIVSVHFHPSIAFIVKGGNRHVLSQHTRKAMEKARGIPSASG